VPGDNQQFPQLICVSLHFFGHSQQIIQNSLLPSMLAGRWPYFRPLIRLGINYSLTRLGMFAVTQPKTTISVSPLKGHFILPGTLC
jgi:hypothetical protein